MRTRLSNAVFGSLLNGASPHVSNLTTDENIDADDANEVFALRTAVVQQAVDDYWSACKTLTSFHRERKVNEEYIKYLKRMRTALNTIDDVVGFFRSPWYGRLVLGAINGEKTLEVVRERISEAGLYCYEEQINKLREIIEAETDRAEKRQRKMSLRKERPETLKACNLKLNKLTEELKVLQAKQADAYLKQDSVEMYRLYVKIRTLKDRIDRLEAYAEELHAVYREQWRNRQKKKEGDGNGQQTDT